MLVSTVHDIVEHKGVKTAILDVSFTAHMPDTLEMPYRPKIIGAKDPAPESKYLYRLGGGSCLAGELSGQQSGLLASEIADWLPQATAFLK